LVPPLGPSPSLNVSAVGVTPMLERRAVMLMISSVKKKSHMAIDSKIISIDYLDSILAKIQAKLSGFDDAIMLDASGIVAEATGANVFSVKGQKIKTPPLTVCLAGITRATVLELADDLGITATESELTTHDLYSADEVFIAGTGIDGIVSVGEIDGRKIGQECPGKITEKLTGAYLKLTRSKYLTSVQ